VRYNIGAFIVTMAENTKLKKLGNDVKKILELVEERNADYESCFTQLEFAMKEFLTGRTSAGLNVDTDRTSLHTTPFQVRNVKLDFPKFDGSNVFQWVFQAGQFFDYYATPDLQRLTIAAIHLKKDVVPWSQMMQKNNLFPFWKSFTRALEVEFGPSPFECPCSKLFKLNQNTLVEEYYAQFTSLANRITGITMDALLDYFISGLKMEIHRDVLSQSAHSLLETVSLARLFKGKHINTVTSHFT